MKTNNFAKSILKLHSKYTQLWHDQKEDILLSDNMTLEQIVIQQHKYNFDLWHEEDKAREPEAPDSTIALVKRTIDQLNQQRNDAITLIDIALVRTFFAACNNDDKPWNSETIGSIIDRLSIASLKAYHMLEQAQRNKASQKHKDSCMDKYNHLITQRRDLALSMQNVVDDIIAGNKQNKLYHQFKMYNDPSLNPMIYGTK